LITRIIFGDEYRSLSSLLCSLLQFPVASSLLGPNILLSTLFSNTLSLCSSFVPLPYVIQPQRNLICASLLTTAIRRRRAMDVTRFNMIMDSMFCFCQNN
jgi:hypothetical protein